MAATLGPDEASARRDALIFIPGLFPEDGVGSADVAARRIARALDDNAKTRGANFLLLESKEETFGEGRTTRKVTVLRREPSGAERPIVDVFDFQYHDTLINGFDKRPPVRQALSIAGTLLAVTGRVIGSMRRRGKTATEKWHVVYGALVVVGLVAYVTVLLATGIAAIIPRAPMTTPAGVVAESEASVSTAAAQSSLQKRAASVRQAATRLWRSAHGFFARDGFKSFIIILSAAGLFTTVSVKSLLREAAVGTSAASGYLATGERAAAIRGAFGSLLQHVLESEVDGQSYERVHVVAFSFGSIVALDSIFPVVKPADHLREIKSLVTVGCPFDFVRTYWPNYFKNRREIPQVPPIWINVFAGADVLGSNFVDEVLYTRRNASGEASPEQPRGIALATGGKERVPESLRYGSPGNLSSETLAERLKLVGFRTHRRAYWDGVESDSCFHEIVPRLYESHHALT